MRVAFAPISFLGSLLPSSRWNPGLAWQWEWRNQGMIYLSMTHPHNINRPRQSIHDMDQKLSRSFLGYSAGHSYILLPWRSLAKLSLPQKSSRKEPSLLQVSGRSFEVHACLYSRHDSQYGANLFTTNGSEWRRHRRIMGPAFSQETCVQ